jgi:superfamily II helicase
VARSLTGKSEDLFCQLNKYLLVRDETLQRYRVLLGVIKRALSAGRVQLVPRYMEMEQELVQRLKDLQKVIDPLDHSFHPTPVEQETLDGFETSFLQQKNRVLAEQKDITFTFQQEMKRLSRQISSLQAIPKSPAAFSCIDEPSRLDVRG